MATIRPLRGIRYNQDKVADLAQVIAPPYDVISSEEQKALYERSPYNIVRLELGQDLTADDATSNRYTRAKSYLDQWLTDGVLVKEAAPALYIHRQEFPFQDGRLTRLGLIAGLELVEWSAGIVLPHEDTLPKPKLDRLDLMRACQCNLSPIMALYEDPQLRQRLETLVNSRPANVDTTAEDGQRHSIWVIDDREMTSWIAQRLAEQQLFIADGHHRYETALQYRRDLEAAMGPLPADHPANCVLATLYDFADPGLVVLPTHRVIRGIERALFDQLMDTLAGVFEVQSWPFEQFDTQSAAATLREAMTMARPTAHAFGIYGPDHDRVHVATLPRHSSLPQQLAMPGSEAYRQLDVSVLQHLIMEPMLGIDSGKITDGYHVAYTRDEEAAIDMVRSGGYQLALLLNSTLPTEIRDVALAGDRMPQKSTYFYPKLPTGVVINPLT